jgi:hypothetical protein
MPDGAGAKPLAGAADDVGEATVLSMFLILTL